MFYQTQGCTSRLEVSNRMRNSPKAVPISALEDVCIGDFIGEKGWLESLFWAGMPPTAQLHYVHESGHTFQKITP